jgi:tetratricopeptide (TPR) repeat protein
LQSRPTRHRLRRREKLFLKQSEAAEADARTALAINPENVRARIVLGGALLDQSIAAEQAGLEPGGLQDQAEAEYKTAVDKAWDASQKASETGASPGPLYAIARLGLGEALVTRGETMYLGSQSAETDLDADKALEEAVRELDRSVVQLLQDNQLYRMVAQYHAAVGTAKLDQGDLASARQDFEQARTFYKEAQENFVTCEAQQERMREDRTLKEDIIAKGCTPALQTVEDKLAQLGG